MTRDSKNKARERNAYIDDGHWTTNTSIQTLMLPQNYLVN